MHHVLDLLEKGPFLITKGYMCNIDFMQGSFYSLILVECVIVAFVEGLLAKFSAFIT